MNALREYDQYALKKVVDLLILEKKPELAEIKLNEYTHRFNNDLCNNFAIKRYKKIIELYNERKEK